MKIISIAALVAGTLTLGGCAANHEPVAPAPPIGAGAIAGTVAADRNGDGIVDGYYTSEGLYHAFEAPPCPPPPPPPPTRRGERG